MWDKMKTANAINAVRNKEMGLEKTLKVSEVPFICGEREMKTVIILKTPKIVRRPSCKI
jgi:hypothetical protein